MSLSKQLRKVLGIGLANRGQAKALADALDFPTSFAPADATGTDAAGVDLVLNTGRGTGAGVGGNLSIQVPFAGSTGTTATPLVERRKIVSKRYPLVTTVAKALFDVALPAGSFVSLAVRYGVRCSDGTDHQAISGSVHLAAVNKAGTYTFTAVDSTACLAASTGTLTLAWTKTNGTNKLTINVAGTTSLTPTTFDVALEIVNHTGAAITLA